MSDNDADMASLGSLAEDANLLSSVGETANNNPLLELHVENSLKRWKDDSRTQSHLTYAYQVQYFDELRVEQIRTLIECQEKYISKKIIPYTQLPSKELDALETEIRISKVNTNMLQNKADLQKILKNIEKIKLFISNKIECSLVSFARSHATAFLLKKHEPLLKETKAVLESYLANRTKKDSLQLDASCKTVAEFKELIKDLNFPAMKKIDKPVPPPGIKLSDLLMDEKPQISFSQPIQKKLVKKPKKASKNFQVVTIPKKKSTKRKQTPMGHKPAPPKKKKRN